MAHVEVTWIGSVILASFILKFSIFCYVMYLNSHSWGSLLISAMLLSCGSVLHSVCSLLASTDFKKIGAILSIIHMNMGMISLYSPGLFGCYGSDMLWTGHSVVAGLFFFSVGSIYATSGARLLHATLASMASSPVCWYCVFSLGILNIGLPLGCLFAPELLFVASLASLATLLELCPWTATLAALSILALFTALRACLACETKIIINDFSTDTLIMFLPILLWIWFLWPD